MDGKIDSQTNREFDIKARRQISDRFKFKNRKTINGVESARKTERQKNRKTERLKNMKIADGQLDIKTYVHIGI